MGLFFLGSKCPICCWLVRCCNSNPYSLFLCTLWIV